MPIIDLHCHLGVTRETRALAQPTLEDALAYAERDGVAALCFAASDAATDPIGGNGRLAQAIYDQPRCRGWLTLSVHQPEVSLQLAAYYFRQANWIGARFEQTSEGDAVGEAGGREILNGLRRFSKPVLLTVCSPFGLHAAVDAAREFHGLRFLLSPQSEEMTSDLLPAVKDVLNISLVPVAAVAERDTIARAVATLGERGDRRVMWASDWGRFAPAAAFGMMKDSAINALQRERIFSRNAAELLT